MVSKNLPKMVKQILSVPGPWSQHVNILYAPDLGPVCSSNFANLRLTLDFELGAKIQFIANQM